MGKAFPLNLKRIMVTIAQQHEARGVLITSFVYLLVKV